MAGALLGAYDYGNAPFVGDRYDSVRSDCCRQPGDWNAHTAYGNLPDRILFHLGRQSSRYQQTGFTVFSDSHYRSFDYNVLSSTYDVASRVSGKIRKVLLRSVDIRMGSPFA